LLDLRADNFQLDDKNLKKILISGTIHFIMSETYQVSDGADAWCRSKKLIVADEMISTWPPPTCDENANFLLYLGNGAYAYKGIKPSAGVYPKYFLCEEP